MSSLTQKTLRGLRVGGWVGRRMHGRGSDPGRGRGGEEVCV